MCTNTRQDAVLSTCVFSLADCQIHNMDETLFSRKKIAETEENKKKTQNKKTKAKLNNKTNLTEIVPPLPNNLRVPRSL